MSDTNKQEAQAATSSTDKQQSESEAQDVKSLPQWAQDLISAARNEAASYRTARNEAQTALDQAEQALAKAVKPEDYAAIKADLTTAQEQLGKTSRELWVSQAAQVHSLPDWLAKRLTGATAEEIEADAKALASQFGTVTPAAVAVGQTQVPQSPTGGLDPTAGQQPKSTTDMFVEAVS